MKDARWMLSGILILLVAVLGIQKADAQKLYWTDSSTDKVQRANLDGSNVEDVIANTGAIGSTRPAGIALDGTGGKLYWTDLGNFPCEASAGLYSANLDGSGAQNLASGFGLFGLQGIEVDTGSGKVYWGPTHQGFCGDLASIRSSNLDGSNSQVLLQNAVCWFPGGLGVDLAGGAMYWGDASCAALNRANLDGTNPQIGFLSPGCDVRDIEVEPIAGKMYFTCGFFGPGRILVANLDGSGLQTLISGLNFPWGIAVDPTGGKMYWAEIWGGVIRRANLDGTNVEDLVTGLGTPVGVDLLLDSDGDGVPDNLDVCPGTAIPEGVPTRYLGVNRWALVDQDGVFDTTPPPGGGGGPGLYFTIHDTAGCSCEQIIAALGLGKGHVKFGCSISAMEEWIALVNP